MTFNYMRLSVGMISVWCIVECISDRALAQVMPLVTGHLHPRQESASVDISLLQNQLDGIVNGVNDGVDALTIDWVKIDEAIESWFNSKKLMTGKWEPLKNISKDAFNSFVESTKKAARSHVGLMIKTWNEAVKKGSEDLTAAIEALWKMAPYGKVKGVYRYQQGHEDPGDPGWGLEDAVVIHNFVPVDTSTSFGLGEIEVKATGDLDALVAGASAEIILKLHSQFTLQAYVKLPHQLSPPEPPGLPKSLPPDPPNRPIAGTGFQPSVAAGYKVSAIVSALVKVESWIGMGPIIVDLGTVKGKIEKGKFKGVAANQ
jgi:hypothetical protein